VGRERVLRVSAYAVCVEGGSILLCRIAQGATRESDGRWTLPGGGLDHGEHPRDAVIRELAEETGLSGEVVELLELESSSALLPAWHEHPPTDFHVLQVLYRVRITGGTLRPEVDGTTDEARWFSAAAAFAAPTVEVVDLALRRIGWRPVD
jgi:ADP-ribose pyrophosphatase YjhB (NUDIX family)